MKLLISNLFQNPIFGTSKGVRFKPKTPVEPPDPPPVIGNIQSSVTSSGATITWTTDIPANSVVDYGLTSGYGSNQSNASLVTSHSVTLSGLSASTLYHFKVSSGATSSADNTFTTSAAAPAGVLTIGKTDGEYTAVNLTTEGTLDWYKYGYAVGDTAMTRKSGASLISAAVQIGTYVIACWNAVHRFTWVGGTPNSTGTNLGSGNYTRDLNDGWVIDVEADTTQKTAYLYLSMLKGTARVTVSLDDGSAATVFSEFSASGTELGTRFEIAFKSGVASNLRIEVKATVQESATLAMTLQGLTIF